MKILIIDENISRFGGVERVISTLANGLSEKCEVDVLSEYRSSYLPFYNYDSKININYLLDLRELKSMKIKNKNLQYYYFKVIDKIYKKIEINIKIRKAISDFNNYDYIIFGRVFTAVDFMKKINVKNKKYKIIVRDAIHLFFYNKRIQNVLQKLFPQLVDYFVVSSDESMNVYKSFFKKDVKMIKIYNPLGITPIVKYNYDSKKIVTIGRLDSQKGYDNVIKAFSIISKDNPDWKLEIYGSGPEKSKIEKLISNLKLENNVNLLDKTRDVVKVLNNSSMYVMSSRYEGYANMLVEAMACGIPSISYDWLMGIDEIIKNGQNGSIVKLTDRYKYFKGNSTDEDITNLANEIERLINDKEKCDMYSKNSILIQKSRNKETIIKEWFKILNKNN